ncbi:anti-phage dCTP deaminase [Pseudonocardia sp. TMWB2A]|uniref:anti-phage dCTP deaminase n=1 Tax=Pseudonocardia sp. TMWB2A TaxID=687430 RepID=UPI00307FAFC6
MKGNQNRPDLYIGLVCAAGTDLSEVKRQIKAQLAVVNYKHKEIKVSVRIAEAVKLSPPEDAYTRIIELMGAGDEIRKASDDGSGVASLIVTAIRAERENHDFPNSTAFVIDSLKNPKEVEVLDQIYSKNYYTVAVYSPLQLRKDNLSNQICQSRHEPMEDNHREQAKDIIKRDEKGIGDKGQSVRDTFPLADFFIDTQMDIAGQIKRFIELVFSESFITPTNDEYMMFVAKATAMRSCDLSRQVGAVIAEKSGSIVATGCNEVPAPRGGFFFEGRDDTIEDNRDKVEQHDPNFHEIKRSISELIDVMKSAGFIDKSKESSTLAEQLLHGEHKELTSEARIRNLIEFGRVVHAEMHAITQAANLGRSVKDGVLYCTTYPCHICARHIIAAGIKEVVYIEPYPKSLTANLYHREIISELDGANAIADDEPRVLFKAFRGISPVLYQRVFNYRRRKDSYGAIAQWKPEEATPIGAAFGVARKDFELVVANGLEIAINRIHSPTSERDGDPQNVTKSA